MNLRATQSHNIHIIAGDYYNAIYNGQVYAENASIVNLYCDSTYDKSGCYYLSLYIPQNRDSIFNLNCTGYGCNSLRLHDENEFYNVDFINYNLCGCSSNNVYNCISSWNLSTMLRLTRVIFHYISVD